MISEPNYRSMTDSEIAEHFSARRAACDEGKYVILGSKNRSAYFGRIAKIVEGRVYLVDAFKLPWAFAFENMLAMAHSGPPRQNTFSRPVLSGSVTVFRPEEMIECAADAVTRFLADWPTIERQPELIDQVKGDTWVACYTPIGSKS